MNNCCASLNIPDESDNASQYKLTISLNQMKECTCESGVSMANLIPLQVLAAKSADLALKWVTAINDASNQLSRVTLSSSSQLFFLLLLFLQCLMSFYIFIRLLCSLFFSPCLVGKVKAFTIYDAPVHFHEKEREEEAKKVVSSSTYT